MAIQWQKPEDVEPQDGQRYLVSYGTGQMSIVRVRGITLKNDDGDQSSLQWPALHWVCPIEKLAPDDAGRSG